MNQSAEHIQQTYFAKLDALFATATAAVILFCLMTLPFLPFSNQQRWHFVGVLTLAAVVFVVRYVWWRNWSDVDTRYYVTDIANPFLIGLLIQSAGHIGVYLFFLFTLAMISSLAILRFRHVLLTATIVAGYSVYLFFFTNSFQLDESERFLAGGIALMVLFLMTLFTYVIIHEILDQLADLEALKLDFIQDVSHELRTPLTVIKTASLLLSDRRLLRRRGRSNRSKELVDQLESAAQDLEVVTERLSDSSKKVADGRKGRHHE